MNSALPTTRSTTRVLVAEDDALVARDVAETLRELGYHVSEVVGSGDAALASARRDRPDVALMDIRMPGDRDGVDAGRVLMEELDLPVVYVTAYGDEATLGRAMDMRPYGYVLKPFDPRELRSAVEIALERRAVEERIRDSEERFLATLRSIGEAVVATDAHGRVRFLNPSAERLTGLDQADAVGREVEDVIRFRAEEGGASVAHPIRRALAEGRVVTLMEGTVMEAPDGRATPVSDSAAPIVTPGGGLEGGVLVVRDETELREKERRFRESEARFRQIAEHIDDVFWISTPDKDHMDYVSPAFDAIWGRSREDVLADPMAWVENIHPEDRERVRAALPRQALGTYEEEYRIVRPDGELRWIWDRAFPVEGPDGEVVRVVGVAEDVTERVAMERRMAQGQKMEAVGQLAGGVAHDFNNLLTVIRSQADLLLEDLDEESPLREEVELIRGSATRAAKLTSQLLAFSRDQMLRPQVVDLSAVVGEMGRLVERLLGEGIAVVFDLAEDLPPVEIDAGQLEQVVMNLAVNARDAMPEGGTLTLRTHVEEVTLEAAHDHAGLEPGTHVTLQVSDTGVGMDEETRARIFDPFFTTKAMGKGTGLGMAMVYGMVKQSGGAIHVESEPGRGADFRLRFPPAPKGATPSDPERDRGRIAEPRTSTSARVLVVEDDPSVRSVTVRILRRAGFQVEAVEDAEEAVAAVERGTPLDLLVTDMGLPGSNGPALIRALRRARPHLPAVAMSGYAQGALEGSEDLPGDVPFLPKPFSPADLVALVRSLLEE